MKTYNCPVLSLHPLYNEIIKELEKNRKRGQALIPSPSRVFHFVMLMKYLVETNNLSYQDIMNDKVDELFDLLHKTCDDFTIFNVYINRIRDYKLYKLLKYVAFDDYAISNYDNIVLDNYIDSSKKYLFVANGDIPYLPYKNVDVFDDTFRSKKLNKYTPKCFEYFVYDKILGIERKFYTSSFEIDEEYDAIIFINGSSKFMDYHSYLLSKNIRMLNIPVFAIYQYRQISKLRLINHRLHDLNKIIINNNIANLIFDHCKKEINKPISQIKVNIKDISLVPCEKISEILSSDEIIPGISTNATLEDLENHNYRVGISTYENNDEHNKIIQLIDKNEEITNRIHKLDEEISYKIDELIVR